MYLLKLLSFDDLRALLEAARPGRERGQGDWLILQVFSQVLVIVGNIS